MAKPITDETINYVSDERLNEIALLEKRAKYSDVFETRIEAKLKLKKAIQKEWPALLARLRKAEAERDRYKALVLFMRSSFNRPASGYSMIALDTLFEMLRDKIDAFDSAAIKETGHD